MSNDLEILKGIARLEITQESIKEDIIGIKKEDVKQNQLLAEHILGVTSNIERINIERQVREDALKRHEEQAQNRYKDIEMRLADVEFLPNLVKGIWKVTKWLGGFSAAVLLISKFLGMW